MLLPQLYLIGAPKAGTTSVATWLRSHPAVYWSVPKEPYYWAADYPQMRAHYGYDTRRAYEALFSSQEARAAYVRAEGSTTYLYSRAAVPDILSEIPSARFIVCLRNPVDLLVSYHRSQIVVLNEDEPDFGVAWRRSVAGRLPSTDPLDAKLVDYVLVGSQGKAVERLLTIAPREQVHFIVFDDLASQPDAVYRLVEEYAGLDPAPTPELTAVNASNKMYRSRLLRKSTHRPPRMLAPAVRAVRHWSRTTDSSAVMALKRHMWRKEEHPLASEADRRLVADYLRSDVVLLSDVVGRDLTQWTS